MIDERYETVAEWKGIGNSRKDWIQLTLQNTAFSTRTLESSIPLHVVVDLSL